MVCVASRTAESPGEVQAAKTEEIWQAVFRLNDWKPEALIKATTDDMAKAETAVLRMANDKYRKAIFSAQLSVGY